MQYRINTIKTVHNKWGNVHYINNSREHYVMTQNHHNGSMYCELVRNGFVKLHKYCTPETTPETVLELIKTGL